MRFFIGVDLGQRDDFTAIAVCEKIEPEDGDDYVLHVRHLERFRGLKYPAVVERIQRLVTSPELAGKHAMAVDGTGVGVAIVDLLRDAGMTFDAVLIHGGDAETASGYSEHRVPKRNLVGTLQVLMQSGRLCIGKRLRHASTLRAELQNFRVTIDPRTAHDSYSHWREQAHDDLVLATSMAAWKAQKPEFEVLIGRA